MELILRAGLHDLVAIEFCHSHVEQSEDAMRLSLEQFCTEWITAARIDLRRTYET
jgi:hypothetical protein